MREYLSVHVCVCVCVCVREPTRETLYRMKFQQTNYRAKICIVFFTMTHKLIELLTSLCTGTVLGVNFSYLLTVLTAFKITERQLNKRHLRVQAEGLQLVITVL